MIALSACSESSTSAEPTKSIENWDLAYAAAQQARHFEELGDYSSAIKSYNSAIAAFPSEAQFYIRLGALHKKRGEYELAAQAFEKSLNYKLTFGKKRMPPSRDDSAGSRCAEIADLHDRLGHTEKADDFYKKAVTLNADSHSIWKAYADFLKRHGREKEAAFAREKMDFCPWNSGMDLEAAQSQLNPSNGAVKQSP